MDKAKYKNEIYNIETIYVYDELITIYKGNLLETTAIKVKLSEVEILSLYCVMSKFSAEKLEDAYSDGLDYGMGNGGLKFHLENYR